MIDSYLGLKYGRTLKDDNNYTNSQFLNVWQNDIKYSKNIVALGKDNNTTLDQRISKSQQLNASLTISLDKFS